MISKRSSREGLDFHRIRGFQHCRMHREFCPSKIGWSPPALWAWSCRSRGLVCATGPAVHRGVKRTRVLRLYGPCPSANIVYIGRGAIAERAGTRSSTAMKGSTPTVRRWFYASATQASFNGVATAVPEIAAFAISVSSIVTATSILTVQKPDDRRIAYEVQFDEALGRGARANSEIRADQRSNAIRILWTLHVGYRHRRLDLRSSAFARPRLAFLCFFLADKKTDRNLGDHKAEEFPMRVVWLPIREDRCRAIWYIPILLSFVCWWLMVHKFITVFGTSELLLTLSVVDRVFSLEQAQLSSVNHDQPPMKHYYEQI